MKKYSLKKDHEEIKAQIKEWEKILDSVINCLQDSEVYEHHDCIEDLEKISHEMTAINI
jgi:hypothetical protein